VVATHERLSDRNQTRYDWQHYVPLIERKPGALRNGAPFADLPEPLQRMRRALVHQEGGDKVMAQVLAEVPKQGLDAVLVAVELALESAPPSGRVSTEHVINVLGRLQAQPLPETVQTILQVSQTPLADTARYDSLRAASDVQERVLLRLGQLLAVAVGDVQVSVGAPLGLGLAVAHQVLERSKAVALLACLVAPCG